MRGLCKITVQDWWRGLRWRYWTCLFSDEVDRVDPSFRDRRIARRDAFLARTGRMILVVGLVGIGLAAWGRF